jgi:hypothetical protein
MAKAPVIDQDQKNIGRAFVRLHELQEVRGVGFLARACVRVRGLRRDFGSLVIPAPARLRRIMNSARLLS